MSIQDIFKLAVERHASDVHLVVGRSPFLRIDGVLTELNDFSPLDAKTAESLITTLLSKEQKEQFFSERDLDFSYTLDGARFRVNIHFAHEHMGLVARVIHGTVPTLEALGLSPAVRALTTEHDGLIIVTGPTGSGKSTLLASMIESINMTRGGHIVTLEDPVEFLFTSKQCIIKQREVGADVRSFAAGLKHVLRQDPNVIMVGEMRDLETIAAALTSAETGHLVMATLHTADAAQAIDRIIDVFPPYQQQQIRLQLSMVLRAVIAQRLLPKVGGGRVATREVLLNNHAVANLIREAKTAQVRTVMQTGAKEGMTTFEQDIQRLLSAGTIDAKTAEAQTVG
ncbi:PilT/PilU family type 4a pilus ATPase [Candidatus Uhrbacteria bacterium]|nr:PilT/PilU family type 4a pilus ATPase [Candidatus Uhrbacteria bacterium]